MFFGIWLLVLLAAIVALIQAYFFFMGMVKADPGSPTMQRIAGFVREGANAYLTQQYTVVAIFFVVIAAVLALLAFVFEVQSRWVPFAFMTGGLFSGLAGWIGMKTATLASNRTAAGAQKSLNQGLQVAFRSGAVMGLTVVGLGLLDIVIWFGVLYWVFELSLFNITTTMLCFGMGASCQALFARVGGGIFTKAADVGADLVGKVEQGIPEDDPRNPASIADNVGDNVGDVAGMGADLYESYCGSILATAALGVAAFSSPAMASAAGYENIADAQIRAVFVPMLIAAMGMLLSIGGVYLVRTQEGATQKNLLAALSRGINAATAAVAVVSILICIWLMPAIPEASYSLGVVIPGVSFSILVGLAAGWLIGKWTEYATSDEFTPTKNLAEQAETGPATIIIGGIADGMLSVWPPVIVIAVATVASFGFANGWSFDDPNLFSLGLYGVGIAAVGMLSTLGITLATDAYGPIADNAGGNAEMSHLEPIVRERTDALDSLGNTTAATGKGFAIGSAALTALALMAAYVEVVREGFERWSNSTAAIVEYDTPTKIAPGLVILKQKHDNTDHVFGYLPMPTDLRHAEVQETWETLGSDGKPAALTPEFMTIADGEGEPQLAFESTGAKLINIHEASLSDFATYYEAHVMNPRVLVGIFIGAMATFVFCALTMKAVGRAAKGMVEEVRRQFREKPGIMDNSEEPDYAAPVEISTKAAQMEMIVPSLLGLITPIAVGWVLGVGGVLGLLVGALTSGFCLAVFMANSGGSWDNAKKYIEAGHHGGKGSDAHKAAVVGDTVGDPFKDTSGPSLNILIKLMSMVSLVVGGFVVRYSLIALGIF